MSTKLSDDIDGRVAAFGLAIREVRKARHVTQDMLAHAMSCDHSYISHIEHGRKNPTLGTIYFISSILETPLETLARRATELHRHP